MSANLQKHYSKVSISALLYNHLTFFVTCIDFFAAKFRAKLKKIRLTKTKAFPLEIQDCEFGDESNAVNITHDIAAKNNTF